ncbi:MAG TPA: ABC transporter permease subunit [Actinomycetes bacterium]|nr:ABC transporter permease subunit [Actinomycetes bacterium]
MTRTTDAAGTRRPLVLTQMLASRRRSTLWWSVGMAFLVLVVIASYPSVRDSAEGFESYLESLPEGFAELVGAEGGIAAPAGYLNSQMYSNMYPLLLIVLGISAASWAVAGSEGEGTLEMLLANPVTRSRVAVERLAGVVVLTGAVSLAATVVLVLTAPVVELTGLPSGALWAAGLGSWTLALCFAGVSFGVGAATGSKAAAIGSGSAAAAGTYVLYGLSAFVQAIEPVRWLSPWFWFLDSDPLTGVTSTFWVQGVLLPLAVGALFSVAGVAVLVRRDLH